MKLVAGVDGGNTKTIALVCDLDGQVRGVGRAGQSNWEGLGLEGMAEVISKVVDEALGTAGAGRDDIVHAHLCMAGVDWPDDVPRHKEAIAAAGWECGLVVENDSFLSVRASSPEGHGIGVMAGTGICSAIIRPDGEKYFYGGFTDLGGGWDVDRQVLYAVIRAEDGRGPATALTEAVLEATGYGSVPELVYAMHREEKWISKQVLHPVLFSTAAKEDPAAVEIVNRFSRELALCATNLMRRYGLLESDTAVVASGSLFMKTGPLLFDGFRREVLAAGPRVRLILAEEVPVMGAVRGALEAAVGRSPEVWGNVRRSVDEGGWLAGV